jgi:DNA-binding transcriptional LysR family regulator
VALLPTPFDSRGLDSEPLMSGPRVVALAAADPLAARKTVRLSDLAGRRLPDGTAAEKGGLEPLPAGYRSTLDLSQIFNLVEVGSIVWFLPEWVAVRFPRPNLAYQPVEGLEPVTLAVAWPAESRSTAVAAFVRTAKAVAAATVEDQWSAAAGVCALWRVFPTLDEPGFRASAAHRCSWRRSYPARPSYWSASWVSSRD